MKSGLKFIINISIILIGVSLMLATSLLLEIDFISHLAVRQIIIYILILLELYITGRIIFLLNKNEEWMKSMK